jgi:hypothetical protein
MQAEITEFSTAQLDALSRQSHLYPDELLTQILMASTFRCRLPRTLAR